MNSQVHHHVTTLDPGLVDCSPSTSMGEVDKYPRGYLSKVKSPEPDWESKIRSISLMPIQDVHEHDGAENQSFHNS